MDVPSPPWKKTIENALEKRPDAVNFSLASCSSPYPFVRTHVFRSFLSPASDPSLLLILTTTDVRSTKISQVIPNPHVQLCWWIEGISEQYRISGSVYIVPAPIKALHQHFQNLAQAASKDSALAALHREGFDWEAKRVEVFRSLSTDLRASFCRPLAPGVHLKDYEESERWPVALDEPKPGDPEGVQRPWAFALENFSLVVIDAMEVDRLEAAVVPPRRTRYWKTCSDLWKSELLVP